MQPLDPPPATAKPKGQSEVVPAAHTQSFPPPPNGPQLLRAHRCLSCFPAHTASQAPSLHLHAPEPASSTGECTGHQLPCLFSTYTHSPGTILSRLLKPRSCATGADSPQSCPTLCGPVDCSRPGSCVHGILQAGILEWAAMPSSRGSS